MNQTTIFDMMYPKYKIIKPIRLIEMFAGYGSQALALKYLGIPFEHWKICEWAVKSIQAYKDIHFENNNIDYLALQPYDDKRKWLISWLFERGISSNYNEPMTKEQISRLNDKQLKTIYNNIVATNNMVNIQQVKGENLEIVDTDKYDYIMTYSFPCQDLSLAGKGKGMSDTSTRSGMLWEVERILTECHELGTMPQILLMENVPQVHSADNMPDFHKWQVRLEELGYKSYWQDLIATDYGIPQTRNRCFMVSILGDYSYTFPKPIPLKLKLKDMLENNVDEKYYLSNKLLNCFMSDGTGSYTRKERFLQNINRKNQDIANSITTLEGNRITCTFIKDTENYIEWKEEGKLDIDCRASKEDKVSTTICTTPKNKVLIKNATKQGYLEATDGDGIDLSMPNSKTRRGRVQKNAIQTLTTQNNLGVCIGTYQYAKSDNFMQGRDKLQLSKETSDTLQTTPKEGIVTMTAIIEKHNKNAKHQQDIVQDSNGNARTLVCGTHGNGGHYTKTIMNDLRIRKLTPRECFRLMGVKDEDFDKVAKNQSDSSLYHLAGDSIVVNVLVAIFNELLESKGE